MKTVKLSNVYAGIEVIWGLSQGHGIRHKRCARVEYDDPKSEKLCTVVCTLFREDSRPVEFKVPSANPNHNYEVFRVPYTDHWIRGVHGRYAGGVETLKGICRCWDIDYPSYVPSTLEPRTSTGREVKRTYYPLVRNNPLQHMRSSARGLASVMTPWWPRCLSNEKRIRSTNE